MQKKLNPHAPDDHLEKLSLAFREQALSEAETLLDLNEKLKVAGGYEVREATLSAIRVLVHRLAGRGGTFGYPDISIAASELEQTIDDVLPQVSCQAPDAMRPIHALLRALCAVISTLEK